MNSGHLGNPIASACFRFALFAFLLGMLPVCRGAETAEPAEIGPAKFKISGYGLFGNRQLRRLITTLQPGKEKPEFFTPAFVEDAALILAARVRRDGYLNPRIQIEMEIPGGNPIEVTGTELMNNPLPPAMRIRRVHFQVHEGVLYHFKSVKFQGLSSVPTRKARSFFYETEPLVKTKGTRVYTPSRLRRGISSLHEILDRQGFRDARVEPVSIVTNNLTGGVRVVLRVEQGARYVVRSVREELFRGAKTNDPPVDVQSKFPLEPFSQSWQDNLVLGLKTNQFRAGYPDTTVEISEITREPQKEFVEVDLLAKIHAGPNISIASVKFEGQKRTRDFVMRRRARVERGDPLDPVRVERGRQRLAELGTFESVTTRTEPVDENHRDVIYEVKEGRLLNVNLLFGYGSYELLRGGAELELFNLWGLAHSVRLKGVQSFKSSTGDLLYNIPDFMGRNFDVFAQGNGLRREEVSFTREEFGGGVGVHRFFRPISSDMSLRYNYQVLNAVDLFPAVASEGLTNPSVGAIVFDFKHDRRDNPLLPRSGYKVFATFETASDSFGGDANYQRVDLSPSVHVPLGRGAFFSAGITHGSVISSGDVSRNLPFNRRYFPGGGNSIRGYPEGEASPENADGEFVGAESFTLATVEFEQSITRSWSVVLFSDSLGAARRIGQFPWDTELFTVGGGLRWRTMVGPVRAEYGHNLNPRDGDPSGAFHISLGFPF